MYQEGKSETEGEQIYYCRAKDMYFCSALDEYEEERYAFSLKSADGDIEAHARADAAVGENIIYNFMSENDNTWVALKMSLKGFFRKKNRQNKNKKITIKQNSTVMVQFIKPSLNPKRRAFKYAIGGGGLFFFTSQKKKTMSTKKCQQQKKKTISLSPFIKRVSHKIKPKMIFLFKYH